MDTTSPNNKEAPAAITPRPSKRRPTIQPAHESAEIWRHLWPTSSNVVKIAGADLPHVIPGADRVPPFSVRFKLPPGYNTDYEDLAKNIRNEIVHQLLAINVQCGLDAEVTFPNPQGPGTNKVCPMDITLSNPQHLPLLEIGRA